MKYSDNNTNKGSLSEIMQNSSNFTITKKDSVYSISFQLAYSNRIFKSSGEDFNKIINDAFIFFQEISRKLIFSISIMSNKSEIGLQYDSGILSSGGIAKMVDYCTSLNILSDNILSEIEDKNIPVGDLLICLLEDEKLNYKYSEEYMSLTKDKLDNLSAKMLLLIKEEIESER